MSATRVRMVGRVDGWRSPGGGERQLVQTAAALRSLGIDARAWRPWDESPIDCDVLHLFGTQREHFPLVMAAKRQGRKVVVSSVAWYSIRAAWGEPRRWQTRLRAAAAHLMRPLAPAALDWRRRLYSAADLILPNSQREASQLQRLFRVPAEKLRIVPNGATPCHGHDGGEAFARLTGCRDYVLYAGRVEPRKNQLAFLRAMRGAVWPIVVLGNVVPGYERYYDRCRRAAGDGVHFVSRIDDAALLTSAYAGARTLALVSWFETPGLVALEAGSQGTPLVLSYEGAGREYFGALAEYASPSDLRAIRSAVERAATLGKNPALAAHVRQYFTWRHVAQATCSAYATVC